MDARNYDAPVNEILSALEVVGLADLLELEPYRHLDRESVAAALTEFGRFASEVLAPIDAVGDAVGSQLDPATGTVVTPPGFIDAYRRYVAGGWGAIAAPLAVGGGGFPTVAGLAFQEMFAAANVALSLNPMLTQGTVELLATWGDDGQRQRFMPKMITGEWCGTTELTEPEAGSDLGAIETYAEPLHDGTWSVTGTKVFITWGEHDLAEQIIHFVLARTPDAPAGTKGLSLFAVPKIVGPTGAAAPNALRCTRVERKLGLHASPTCVMEYAGAIGELVGGRHGGLRAMFTTMNLARLSIGVQGPAIGERAYQLATTYAADRLQGRAPGTAPPTRSPIAAHPDVARMLLGMRTLSCAARLVCYFAAANSDFARAGDPADRSRSRAYSELVTPIAKAWSTEAGFTASSMGMQVLGGLGYLEESGMPQRLRDARIGSIYEGTNGIQAIDLVTRKVPRDGGRWVLQLIDEVTETAKKSAMPELAPTLEMLEEAATAFGSATRWVLARSEDAPEDALAGATAYLELAGVTIAGWLMARRALALGSGDAVMESNFFASETVTSASGLARTATAGASRLGRSSRG